MRVRIAIAGVCSRPALDKRASTFMLRSPGPGGRRTPALSTVRLSPSPLRWSTTAATSATARTPFATLPYSILAAGLAGNHSAETLLAIQLAAVALVFATTAVQCSLGVFESPAYALASPLSGAIVSFGFMSAIFDAGKRGAVNWRDREYTVSENQHPIR